MSLLEVRASENGYNLYCTETEVIGKRTMKWIEPPFYALYTQVDGAAIIDIAFDHTESRIFNTHIKVNKFALVQCTRCIINGVLRRPSALLFDPLNDVDWLKQDAWAIPETCWFIEQVPGISVPAYRAAALKMATPDTIARIGVKSDDDDLFYMREGYQTLGMGAYLRIPYHPGDCGFAFLEDRPTFIMNPSSLDAVSTKNLQGEPIMRMKWEYQTFACNLDDWRDRGTVLQFCEGLKWSISVERESVKNSWPEAQVQFNSTLLNKPTPEMKLALIAFRGKWNS